MMTLKQKIANEDGFVMPLALSLFLVVSALLLILGARLEMRVNTYDRMRNYMALNVIERQGLSELEDLLDGLVVDDIKEFVIVLGRSGRFYATLQPRPSYVLISYEVVYGGMRRVRSFTYVAGNVRFR